MQHPLTNTHRNWSLFFVLLALAAVAAVLVVRVAPMQLPWSIGAEPAGVVVGPAGNPQTVLVQDGDHIAAVDLQTSRVIYTLPIGLGGTNISMVADTNSGRLFVTDNSSGTDYVTAYKLSDWSVELRLPISNIIRYNGNTQTGIAPSVDGKFLYVYNYNDRTRKDTEPVRYWISVLDLSTGAFLPQEVDLPECGASQLFPMNTRLLVLCYETSDIRVVDTTSLTVSKTMSVSPSQQRSGWSLTGLSAATVLGESVYLVTDNREIHIRNLSATDMDRILVQAASSVQQLSPDRLAAEKVAPIQPIGIAPDGRYLYVPSGTADERSRGIASELDVIDTRSGAIARALHPQPFRWITFAHDGSSAFTVAVGPDGFGRKLVRLDLANGQETDLLSGSISPGLIVLP